MQTVITDEKKCPFCDKGNMEGRIVAQTQNFMIVPSKYPIIKGHMLLIPFKHFRYEHDVNVYFDFIHACNLAYEYVKKNGGEPVTYVNPPTLQSVPHYHRHYLPGNALKPHAIQNALIEWLKTNG